MNNLDQIFDIIAPLLTDLLEHEDLSTFQQGMSSTLSTFFYEEELLSNPQFQSGFAQVLFHNMPLPKRQFKPEQWEKPGRNDPCICGSGKKFKQCCTHLASFPTMISDDLFGMALMHAKTQLWNRLTNHPELPDNLRLIMAEMLMSEGKPKKLWQLTQSLFDNLDLINEKNLELVSLGFEALIDLGHDKKRFNYMMKMSEYSSNKSVQAIGFQRLAMYSADHQDLDSASKYLEKARRTAPENPDLPIVEMSLLPRLVSDQELRDRARFWQKRIQKLWGDNYPYLDVINAFAENGMTAANEMMGYSHDLDDEWQQNLETDEDAINIITERLNVVLLSAIGLSIEGIAHSKNRYHLGTVGHEMASLDAFRKAWMTEQQAKERPGTPREYQDKWKDPYAQWLNELEDNPQLLGHTTVLIELLEWFSFGPDQDSEELTEVYELLKIQRLCLINRLLKQCDDQGVKLDPNAVQNQVLFMLLRHQLDDFNDDGHFDAAVNLVFKIDQTIKNARKLIPEMNDILSS